MSPIKKKAHKKNEGNKAQKTKEAQTFTSDTRPVAKKRKSNTDIEGEQKSKKQRTSSSHKKQKTITSYSMFSLHTNTQQNITSNIQRTTVNGHAHQRNKHSSVQSHKRKKPAEKEEEEESSEIEDGQEFEHTPTPQITPKRTSQENSVILKKSLGFEDELKDEHDLKIKDEEVVEDWALKGSMEKWGAGNISSLVTEGSLKKEGAGNNSSLVLESSTKKEGAENNSFTPPQADPMLSLLNDIEKMLPKKDHQSYQITMKKLDWKKLSSDKMSEEDCKKKFMKILGMLQVKKTLTTLVAEAKELVRTNYAGMKISRSVPSVFSRFMKDYYTEEKQAELKKSGRNNFMVAGWEAWHKLPKKKKEMYMKSFKEDSERLRLVRAKSNRFKAFQAWAEQERSTVSLARNMRKLQQEFISQPDEAKIPYIRIALQYSQDVIRRDQAEGKLTQGKKMDKKDRKKINFCTKDELMLYLRYKKMPELPPYRPHNIFHHELINAGKLDHLTSSKEKFSYSMKQYKILPDKRKSQYFKLMKKSHKEYLVLFKAWESKQDELTLLAKQLLWGMPLPGYLNPKSSATKKTLNVGQEMKRRFPYIVHVTDPCPKFEGQPEMPPRTPLKLFIHKFTERVDVEQFKNKKEMIKACTSKWKALTTLQMNPFLGAWRTMRDRYKKEVLDYVSMLRKKERKIFLGYCRRDLYKFFKEDIFKHCYPNIKYPVYTSNPLELENCERVMTNIVQYYSKPYTRRESNSFVNQSVTPSATTITSLGQSAVTSSAIKHNAKQSTTSQMNLSCNQDATSSEESEDDADDFLPSYQSRTSQMDQSGCQDFTSSEESDDDTLPPWQSKTSQMQSGNQDVMSSEDSDDDVLPPL